MLFDEEDPFFEVKKLQKRMNKFFGDFPDLDINIPATDISETEDKVILRLDMPGITKDDIEIYSDGNLIELKAERKKLIEDRKENFYRQERSWKKYHRQIPMPVKIDSDKIAAKYENGVLKIIADKKEKSKFKKKIPIN